MTTKNNNTTTSLLRLCSKLLLVVMLIGMSLSSVAQSQNEDIPVEHVVYLKDGSVFKGVIVDEDNSYLYMVILDGTTIDIAHWRVKKVMSNENFLFHSKGRYHYTNGFFWNLQIGFSPTAKIESEHVSLEVGYRINKRWSMALGLGSEFTTTTASGFAIETLFNSFYLYNRYYLTDQRRRPFVYHRIGYGTGPEDEIESGRHSGGLQTQAGLGIHFASKKRSRFLLSLGYHIQHTSGEQFFLDTFGQEILVEYPNYFVRHFILKFGIEFR